MAQKKREKGRKKEGSSKEEQDTIKITIEAPMHIAETALKMTHDIFGFMASIKKKKEK